ncbi:hypothetical protein IWX49DRAFT_388416, partial [Phyllosticta citricarpa]
RRDSTRPPRPESPSHHVFDSTWTNYLRQPIIPSPIAITVADAEQQGLHHVVLEVCFAWIEVLEKLVQQHPSVLLLTTWSSSSSSLSFSSSTRRMRLRGSIHVRRSSVRDSVVDFISSAAFWPLLLLLLRSGPPPRNCSLVSLRRLAKAPVPVGSQPSLRPRWPHALLNRLEHRRRLSPRRRRRQPPQSLRNLRLHALLDSRCHCSNKKPRNKFVALALVLAVLLLLLFAAVDQLPRQSFQLPILLPPVPPHNLDVNFVHGGPLAKEPEAPRTALAGVAFRHGWMSVVTVLACLLASRVLRFLDVYTKGGPDK